MDSQSLVSYIEKVRYGRNISQEKMLSGIISIRQYRRYLYGEIEIPFGIFAQLASRMNISPTKLLLEFEVDRNKQRRAIVDFYNAVISQDIEHIKKIKDSINDDVIIDNEQKLLFNSALIHYNYNTGKISKDELIKKHEKLVNYPDVMKNKILTDIEMVILGTLLNSAKTSYDDIIARFEMIFENNEFQISGDNVTVMIQLLYWLAKIYGVKGEYEKVLQYCDLGISSGEKYRTTYLMGYFKYYKALVYHRWDKLNDYKNNLYEAILYTEIMPNRNLKEQFQKIIKKDLGIDPLKFMHEYTGTAT